MRRNAPILSAFALLAWAALPVPEAVAQFRSGGTPAEPAATRPPPAALPGLQHRTAPEPIPPEPGQNLAPNAALFDAINRGDLPAAQEAIGRGATLQARNVLGLTPIDAAVDQGRTEIMFYLLSVRGGMRPAPLPPEATAAAPARPEPRRSAAPSRVAERPLPATVQQPASPQLWAGNGGAPNPTVGFLGFDAGRPAGAAPPTSRTGRPGRG
jgi:hypothetical protein